MKPCLPANPESETDHARAAEDARLDASIAVWTADEAMDDPDGGLPASDFGIPASSFPAPPDNPFPPCESPDDSGAVPAERPKSTENTISASTPYSNGSGEGAVNNPPRRARRAPSPGRGEGKTDKKKKSTMDAGDYVERKGIWWLAKGNQFWMRGPDDRWMMLNETAMTRWLEADGLRCGTASEPIGEVERVMLYAQGNRQLAGVMNLAGHVSGVEEIRGARVLIKEGPALLEPVKGEWPLVKRLMENLFCLELESGDQPTAFRLLEDGVGGARNVEKEAEVWRVLCQRMRLTGEETEGWYFDQRTVVYAWLRLTLEVYYERQRGNLKAMRNGQALAIAGPPKGGKSLLFSYVIAPILGNRMSNAAKYLQGKTQFNGNLFGSELLLLSDTPLSTKTEDRNTLGDGIKMVAAEQWHAWEGKGKDAVDQLNPIWRLLIGLNDDEQNIRTLPSFSVEGVGDKIHLLHAWKRPMPVPTTTLAEYLAFGEALSRELPAFVHWLLHEFEIPPALRGSRFGMITIQSPDLMREMFEESKWGEMLELIDHAKWNYEGRMLNLWEYVQQLEEKGSVLAGEVKEAGGVPMIWVGSAMDLKHALCADHCTVHREAQGLFKFHCPKRLMGRLAKDEMGRVKQYRTNEARLWKVSRPGVVVC